MGIDTALIVHMRFLAIFTVIMITCGSPYAATPLPPETPSIKKPIIAKKFEKIIDDATQINLSDNDIILPPSLPPIKQYTMTPPSEVASTIDGTPMPSRKPLNVRVTRIERPQSPATPQNLGTITKQRIIPYDSFDSNDRTAGESRPKRTIERTPSAPTINLRETNDKSPFKTAKLPRASKDSQFDPVIVFFKENSPEAEVGQIDILKNDVITVLKQSPRKTASVYGYAERSKNPDDANKLSLSRALMISEYLVRNRINANRIEVRSMAYDTPISPRDRVDIVIQ